MSAAPNTTTIARCVCGSVEIEAIGAPIVSAVCHCDDCQEGSGQIERLPGAPPVLDPAGGSAYLLYRKDRMQCSTGAEQLRDHRLKRESKTRRVVATCCNSAMFLDFEKGHWFSMYRARFAAGAAPPQMRVQTKFAPRSAELPGDVPSYPGYPLAFISKLVVSRFAMMLRW
ncbi:MAG: GFA family protein [Candidatus Binatia bacterium]